LELELLLELELELLLEFELEFELELELELEFELLLELELELLLWFELEFELELLFWFELEFELELLFLVELDRGLLRRLEVAFRRSAEEALSRLIVRRFCTARARHHSIDFPSILCSTATGARADLSEIGATLVFPSSDRDGRGSQAAPTAMPRAPSAPAYIARIFLLSNGMRACLSRGSRRHAAFGLLVW
jgi:hypothetical protein